MGISHSVCILCQLNTRLRDYSWTYDHVPNTTAFPNACNFARLFVLTQKRNFWQTDHSTPKAGLEKVTAVCWERRRWFRDSLQTRCCTKCGSIYLLCYWVFWHSNRSARHTGCVPTGWLSGDKGWEPVSSAQLSGSSCPAYPREASAGEGSKETPEPSQRASSWRSLVSPAPPAVPAARKQLKRLKSLLVHAPHCEEMLLFTAVMVAQNKCPTWGVTNKAVEI